MTKLLKTSLIALLAFFGSYGSSFAKDITLSMWTHNQLYVDYFNTYLDEVQAEFPDDNITFDFQVTPDMATNSLTAIASGSEHTDLLGIEISGFENIKDSILFHSGTKKDGNKIVTNGGRVLAVTSFGKDINESVNKSLLNAKKINFKGKYFRNDIGFDL